MTTTSPLSIASTWDRLAPGHAEEVVGFLTAYAHDALRLAPILELPASLALGHEPRRRLAPGGHDPREPVASGAGWR